MSWQHEPSPSPPPSPKRQLPPDNKITHFELPFFIDGELTPFRFDINHAEGKARLVSDGEWLNILDIVDTCEHMQTSLIVGMSRDKAEWDMEVALANERASNKANNVGDVGDTRQRVSTLGPLSLDQVPTEISAAREAAMGSIVTYANLVAKDKSFLKLATKADETTILKSMQSMAGELINNPVDSFLNKVTVAGDPLNDLGFYKKYVEWYMQFVETTAQKVQIFMALKFIYRICKSKYFCETIANFITLTTFLFCFNKLYPSVFVNVASLEERFVGIRAFQNAALQSCLTFGTGSEWCAMQQSVELFMREQQSAYFQKYLEWISTYTSTMTITADATTGIFGEYLTSGAWSPIRGLIKCRNQLCDFVREHCRSEPAYVIKGDGVKILNRKQIASAKALYGERLQNLLKRPILNVRGINAIRRAIQNEYYVNLETEAGKRQWQNIINDISTP
jgi:hypothetical protein